MIYSGGDLEPTGFWWNRNHLTVGQPTAVSEGARLYEILIPDHAATTDRLLTIGFREKKRDSGRFGAVYDLQAPRLADDLQTAQVYWLIELPYHEHLFTEPAGYAPEYHWEFGKSLWARALPLPSASKYVKVPEPFAFPRIRSPLMYVMLGVVVGEVFSSIGCE